MGQRKRKHVDEFDIKQAEIIHNRQPQPAAYHQKATKDGHTLGRKLRKDFPDKWTYNHRGNGDTGDIKRELSPGDSEGLRDRF